MRRSTFLWGALIGAAAAVGGLFLLQRKRRQPKTQGRDAQSEPDAKTDNVENSCTNDTTAGGDVELAKQDTVQEGNKGSA